MPGVRHKRRPGCSKERGLRPSLLRQFNAPMLVQLVHLL